jgi:ABC-2 type transport system ATP-binding protein
MIGHGWGGTGATSAPAHYADAGYNVLSWDARGFGGSGGTVMIDHPGFEARDAQALIDFIASQPEAALEAPGDPVVGMDGPSYGGGIQFITAARDERVDAIAPTIAWNQLPSSLFKNDSVKLGWDLALVGLGIPTSLLPGVFSPASIQTGHQSPEFYDLMLSAPAAAPVGSDTPQSPSGGAGTTKPKKKSAAKRCKKVKRGKEGKRRKAKNRKCKRKKKKRG